MQIQAPQTKLQVPALRPRPLRTVPRTALVRYFNARGIGCNVDTYA